MTDLHLEIFNQIHADLVAYNHVKKELSRIYDLVQYNPDFFGGPIYGQHKAKTVADWLEEKIGEWKEKGYVVIDAPQKTPPFYAP